MFNQNPEKRRRDFKAERSACQAHWLPLFFFLDIKQNDFAKNHKHLHLIIIDAQSILEKN
jgi:hypothetical protein